MYKSGYNFSKIIFQFAPCMRQSEIIPGQTRLNKKKYIDKTNFIS